MRMTLQSPALQLTFVLCCIQKSSTGGTLLYFAHIWQRYGTLAFGKHTQKVTCNQLFCSCFDSDRDQVSRGLCKPPEVGCAGSCERSSGAEAEPWVPGQNRGAALYVMPHRCEGA